MLVLSRKINERIVIGENIKLEVLGVRGQTGGSRRQLILEMENERARHCGGYAAVRRPIPFCVPQRIGCLSYFAVAPSTSLPSNTGIFDGFRW